MWQLRWSVTAGHTASQQWSQDLNPRNLESQCSSPLHPPPPCGPCILHPYSGVCTNPLHSCLQAHTKINKCKKVHGYDGSTWSLESRESWDVFQNQQTLWPHYTSQDEKGLVTKRLHFFWLAVLSLKSHQLGPDPGSTTYHLNSGRLSTHSVLKFLQLKEGRVITTLSTFLLSCKNSITQFIWKAWKSLKHAWQHQTHVVCCCSVAQLCAEAFNLDTGTKRPLGPRNCALYTCWVPLCLCSWRSAGMTWWHKSLKCWGKLLMNQHNFHVIITWFFYLLKQRWANLHRETDIGVEKIYLCCPIYLCILVLNSVIHSFVHSTCPVNLQCARHGAGTPGKQTHKSKWY